MPKVLLNKKVEPVRSGASTRHVVVVVVAMALVAAADDAFEKDEERSPTTHDRVARRWPLHRFSSIIVLKILFSVKSATYGCFRYKQRHFH